MAVTGRIIRPAISYTKKTEKTKAHEPKARVQERRILEIISELGHYPKTLPERPKGKPGIKAIVRDKALKDPKLFTSNTFDLTWKRLRASGEIH